MGVVEGVRWPPPGRQSPSGGKMNVFKLKIFDILHTKICKLLSPIEGNTLTAVFLKYRIVLGTAVLIDRPGSQKKAWCYSTAWGSRNLPSETDVCLI